MKKIHVTALQRANAIIARDVMWPTVPEENVVRNLNYWASGLNGVKRLAGDATRKGRAATCGTHACFGGWVAQFPVFQTQGVDIAINGAPSIAGDEGGVMIVSDRLFGDGTLFHPREDKRDDPGRTDHQIVTDRLTKLINNSIVKG